MTSDIETLFGTSDYPFLTVFIQIVITCFLFYSLMSVLSAVLRRIG